MPNRCLTMQMIFLLRLIAVTHHDIFPKGKLKLSGEKLTFVNRYRPRYIFSYGMRKCLRTFLNPKDFYAAQRPVLRVSFLVGMTPFTVVKGPTEFMMLRCTPFGYINSGVHVILFCSCYVNALLNGETITRFFFRTDISTLGDVLQFTIGITALFLTFFCSIFQRNKLIKSFHALASIDRRFKEIGMETNYKSTLHYNLLVMCTKVIITSLYLVVCLTVFISSNTYPSVTTWMAFLLPYFMMSMVIVLFLCFVNQTKHRFHLLNKVLKHLKQAALEKRISPQRRPSYWHAIKIQRPLGIASVYSNNDKSMPDVVATVAEIQDALCEACSCAEDYFTIQMLTIVTIVFVIIVFNSYYVLDALLGSTSRDTPFSKGQFAMFFLCQAMVYGFGVFNIVYGSSSLMHENDNIGSNVHKLLNAAAGADSELAGKLMQLSLQMLHRKVRFSACGLFSLDFTLLFTLVGAATTYLVILIQYELSMDESKHETIARAFLGNETW